eukprot:scaffold5439_cov132-Cylindrotheca_fusiformis.AAC.5
MFALVQGCLSVKRPSKRLYFLLARATDSWTNCLRYKSSNSLRVADQSFNHSYACCFDRKGQGVQMGDKSNYCYQFKRHMTPSTEDS